MLEFPNIGKSGEQVPVKVTNIFPVELDESNRTGGSRKFISSSVVASLTPHAYDKIDPSA